MIEVSKIDATTFDVNVAGRTSTRHRVTVEPSYYEQLTGGRVPAETLIEKSFEFLLQREPNTSILQQFDLTVIGRYFPEYEREIRRLLAD